MSGQDDVVQDLVTVRDFIRWGISRFSETEVFFGHGTDNALDEATNLVLHALHLPHDLPGHFMEARLTAEEKSRVTALLRRRVEERIPAAYLTNEAWFAGMPFYVDQRVLIPRSPFAELIEQQFEPWIEPDRVQRILDIGTGSGCIAIAAALAFPEARVDAVDVSAEALDVARMNIEHYALQEQVRPVQSDLFSALGGERYDLIIANPPYVDADEMAALPEEYRQEPELGLAAGAEGLDVVIPLLQQAASHLNPGGILVAEVGASEPALMARFRQVPFMWLDFERGGEGVFLLTCDQLEQHQADFTAA